MKDSYKKYYKQILTLHFLLVNSLKYMNKKREASVKKTDMSIIFCTLFYKNKKEQVFQILRLKTTRVLGLGFFLHLISKSRKCPYFSINQDTFQFNQKNQLL